MSIAKPRLAPLAAALLAALSLPAAAIAADTAAAPADAIAQPEAPDGADAADAAGDRTTKKFKKVEVIGERAPSVTSPKYTQPLIDTPQTLTIIPSAIYEAQAQTTLRDALRNTPGITIQAGEGGGRLATTSTARLYRPQ